ncbi:MAG TPA: AAA domain-containing protein [Gemmatimonadales bacterium]
MIADLVLEIAAAKADAHAHGYPLVGIVASGAAPPFREYTLTLAETPPPMRSEEVVLVCFPNQAPIPVQVLGCRDRTVRVAANEVLPTLRPQGSRLVLDASWLLERLRDRVCEVRDCLAEGKPPEGFNPYLAQLAVGRGDFDCNGMLAADLATGPTPEQFASATECLNEGQQALVSQALRQRVLYLWGPPGTGKTTTIASLVLAHVLAGRRVLIVATSNAAADVAAAAAARRLQSLAGFDRGLLLRIGPRPGEGLVREHGSMLVPHLVASRLSGAAYREQRATAAMALDQAMSARSATDIGTRAEREATRRVAAAEAELRAITAAEMAFQNRCVEDVLSTCQVAVAPAPQLYLSHQVRGSWDVVIVDEASMMTGPQLYLSAGRSIGQVVIAGDFVQLPAPVAHRSPAEVPWLSQDPFVRLGIPDDVAREDDPPYLAMLTEQYRMAPAIADLVGSLFYGGRLRTAPVAARRKAPQWPAFPQVGSLVLVDTTEANPRAIIPAGTGSRSNAVHARIVAELVRDLVGAEPPHAAAPAAQSILVMSPYKGQVALLHKELTPLRRAYPALRLSTVHRAQGDEADTVIFCLDDAPGAPTSSFMGARSWTDTGSRLLNVGLSRARGRLVVLAPVAHLLRAGGPVVRTLLERLVGNAAVIEWAD